MGGVYSLNLWNGDNPISLTHNLVEDLREQVEDNDCLKNDPECSHNGDRCYNVLTGQFHCACNDGYYGKKCESLRRKSVLREPTTQTYASTMVWDSVIPFTERLLTEPSDETQTIETISTTDITSTLP